MPKLTDRAKACEIPQSVKQVVAQRDSVDGWPCCILCGKPAPDGSTEWSNAHYVPRSQGGLGIEQNVLTLCPECHRRFDQTPERAALADELWEYLKSKYRLWARHKCVFDRKEPNFNA